MAGRLTYFKVLRQVHLALSLFILVFTLMYVVTGFILSNHQWFEPGKDNVEEITLPLNVPFDTLNPEHSGNQLRKYLEITGRLEPAGKSGEQTWKYYVHKPGASHEIHVNTSDKSVFILSRANSSLEAVAGGLHKIHDFYGGWKYVLWAVFYDLAAVSLILFAVTGILIWIKLRKAHSWGWPILIVTIAFTAIIIFLLVK